jgi:hypothetical protein
MLNVSRRKVWRGREDRRGSLIYVWRGGGGSGGENKKDEEIK